MDVTAPVILDETDQLLTKTIMSLLGRRRGRRVTQQEAISHSLERMTRELLPSGG